MSAGAVDNIVDDLSDGVDRPFMAERRPTRSSATAL
jgi:hypothetical protein